MIKHIKKKTVNYVKSSQVNRDELNGIFLETPEGIMPNLTFKAVKDKHAILFMESGEVLRSFFYNNNGITCTIPLANPVLIYFHTSQISLNNIYLAKKELLGLFRENEKLTEASLKLFYDFFGITSSFVVLLMTGLEAFVNQNIPIDYQYQKSESDKFTKTYDNNQIQRWYPLMRKYQRF